MTKWTLDIPNRNTYLEENRPKLPSKSKQKIIFKASILKGFSLAGFVSLVQVFVSQAKKTCHGSMVETRPFCRTQGTLTRFAPHIRENLMVSN